MDININILTDQEAAILRETIAASHRIVVCAHKSPDGDAIGSSLGWAGYLRSLDKKVDICVPDMIPDSISWLPGAAGILRYDRQPELVQRAFDEADLVFRVVWQLGGFPQMDQTWATCIYCGMMTDTGGFTYNSTQPYIYYIICLLLTKNIDKDKIYRNVFNNARIPAVRFRGYLMNEKLQVVEGLHASFYTVTRKELKKYDFIKGDLEGLVNVPLTIKGHKLSISLREDTDIDNRILVSLRSVDDFPCNKMAAEFFNGGGHRNASGGKLLCSIQEAEQIALKAILAYADMLK